MKKLIWTVLALAAIVFGALFGVYKHKLKTGKLKKDTGFFAFLSGTGRVRVAEKPDEEAEDKAKPAGRGGAGRSGRPRGTGRGESAKRETGDRPEVDVVTPPFDSKAYDRLKREGNLAYKNANYSEAEKKLSNAAELAKTSKKDDLAKEVERKAMRAKVFNALVSKIQIEPISDGKDIAEISLTFGGRKPFIAKIVEETKRHVKIEKESGMGATFQRDDIDTLERLTPEEYHKHLNKKLDADYRDATRGGKADYLGLYQCVYFAVRFKLADRVTYLLEETFKTEDSQGLISIFCPEDPVNLTVAFLRSYGKDAEAQEMLDANVGPIAMAEPDKTPYREPEENTSDYNNDNNNNDGGDGSNDNYREREEYNEPEEQERSPDEVEGKDDRGWRAAPPEEEGPEESLEDGPEREEPSSGSHGGGGILDSDPDYRAAMKVYNEGLKYYRRSFPGMPAYVKYLKKSLPIMQEAQDLFDRVQGRHPDNQQLDNTMQQLSMIIYDIIKRTPLGR